MTTPPAVGLPAALKYVGAVRRRVERIARQFPFAQPNVLVSRLRSELQAAEPGLARAISDAILLAWLTSAKRTAKGAAVALPEVRAHAPPEVPAPEEPTEHWPAIEAAAKHLFARDVLTPERYELLTDQAKTAAFSVARVASQDAQRLIRNAIGRHVAEGGTLQSFRKEVGGVLSASGLSDPQIETVYRTQIGQAQAAGMRDVLDRPEVAAELPYVAYHAVHDSRTGDIDPRFELPTHRMMEQLGIQGTNIYRADDPVIRKFTPPWRWNCRCHIIPMSIEDAAAAGITEAREWLRTGRPPIHPSWVHHPPFDLPKGWPQWDGSIKSVV